MPDYHHDVSSLADAAGILSVMIIRRKSLLPALPVLTRFRHEPPVSGISEWLARGLYAMRSI